MIDSTLLKMRLGWFSCQRRVDRHVAPRKVHIAFGKTKQRFDIPIVQKRNFDFRPCSTGPGVSPELKSAIDTFLIENKVVVFMKGTKEMPMCGFSNTVVQILNSMNAPFVSVNILENELLRSGMKEYSMWPTFPQVYIDGEFYGGCDIMIESYQNGELAEILEAALNS
eukprot:jgi/Picsp_1/2879/NSC_01104-R1_grx5